MAVNVPSDVSYTQSVAVSYTTTHICGARELRSWTEPVTLCKARAYARLRVQGQPTGQKIEE